MEHYMPPWLNIDVTSITELSVSRVWCTCNKMIREIDTMYCAMCGDVMCEDCYTDCYECGKMYCKNCSESRTQCIKCSVDSKLRIQDKAYLVLNGGTKIPIKNSQFMITKTSMINARDLRLKFDGKEYKYIYRSLNQKEENKNFHDYFLYFEKVEENPIEFPFDYEDYSTLGW